MNEKEFVSKIREILDNESVTMDSALDDIDEWDSLSAVSFIAFANSSFGKTLMPDKVWECKTIRELYGLL